MGERHLRERQLVVRPSSRNASHDVARDSVSSGGSGSRYGTTTVRSSDGHRVLERPHDVEPVVVAAAVAIAVHGEEEPRLDLREAVDDAADAEVGRAARPDRTEARARVEADHGLEHVREVGDDPIARPDPGAAEGRREAPRLSSASSPQVVSVSGRSSEACRTATVSGSRSRKVCSA